MLTPDHNMQLNRKRQLKKKKKGKTVLHTKSQLVAPDLSPNLATPLPSITPVLPFICPAHRPALISACSLDVVQTDPSAHFGTNELLWEGLKGPRDLEWGLRSRPGWVKGAMQRVSMLHCKRLFPS